ncbi:MAG TPA: hypothetical protein VNO79_12205 [Actinomycetota bacterium]|nr:hypothetical protein [Actinomycetota bacterium]
MRRRSALAAELLRELLANGPLPAVEARRELEVALGPVSAQLLGRARRLARVEAVKRGGRWYWQLEGEDPESPLLCSWCGRRFRLVVTCAEHWWPLRQVCNACFEALDALDLEAERGGILKWTGPWAKRIGRSHPR